jgi:HSP20 family molecular chaperone IbpA
MESIMKQCACANVDICQISDNSGLSISAALPGVAKENVHLHMTDEEMCIFGEREDLKYDCCYLIPCEIDLEKVDAHFENGLLTVKAPFREMSRGKEIIIH